MTQVNKQLKEVIAGLDVLNFTGSADLLVSGIHHDSRKLKPGDLFVALPGEVTNGHQFVDAALDSGAVAIVVSEQVSASKAQAVIEVKDPRTALGLIAANFWDQPSSKFQLIGITGTNGKTTFTHLLEKIAEQVGSKPAVIGTVNVRFEGYCKDSLHTTPEASDLQKSFYLMQKADCTHVFMEVSSHALQLQRTVGSHFAVAVFTNLSRDHLDYHKDLDQYAASKSLLFSRDLNSSKAPDKVAVVNIDDPRCHEMLTSFCGRRTAPWRGIIETWRSKRL